MFPCCVQRNIKICHECRRVVRDTEAIYYVCSTHTNEVHTEDNNKFCSNHCRGKYLLRVYPDSPMSDSGSSYFSIDSRNNTPTNNEVEKRKTKNEQKGFDYHEF